MNKIDVQSTSGPRLELESVRLVTLGEFWKGITLSSDYWRFYHHDAPGAAVIVNGQRVEMHANRACLLAPDSTQKNTLLEESGSAFHSQGEPSGERSRLAGPVSELPEGFAAVHLFGLMPEYRNDRFALLQRHLEFGPLP